MHHWMYITVFSVLATTYSFSRFVMSLYLLCHTIWSRLRDFVSTRKFNLKMGWHAFGFLASDWLPEISTSKWNDLHLDYRLLTGYPKFQPQNEMTCIWTTGFWLVTRNFNLKMRWPAFGHVYVRSPTQYSMNWFSLDWLIRDMTYYYTIEK